MAFSLQLRQHCLKSFGIQIYQHQLCSQFWAFDSSGLPNAGGCARNQNGLSFKRIGIVWCTHDKCDLTTLNKSMNVLLLRISSAVNSTSYSSLTIAIVLSAHREDHSSNSRKFVSGVSVLISVSSNTSSKWLINSWMSIIIIVIYSFLLYFSLLSF